MVIDISECVGSEIMIIALSFTEGCMCVGGEFLMMELGIRKVKERERERIRYNTEGAAEFAL